nr:DNA topoisomerase 1-like [Tanacetum cinerariifolium]
VIQKLFEGRGEHPKMGKYKKGIQSSDTRINIEKGEPIPECPIPAGKKSSTIIPSHGLRTGMI